MHSYDADRIKYKNNTMLIVIYTSQSEEIEGKVVTVQYDHKFLIRFLSIMHVVSTGCTQFLVKRALISF